MRAGIAADAGILAIAVQREAVPMLLDYHVLVDGFNIAFNDDY